MKTCTKCGESKPADLEHFYKNPKNRGGLDGYCKPCRRKQSASRDPVAIRDTQLRYTYGIGVKEYDALMEKQSGVCAICKGPPRGKKYLSVDHCADSGRIRGLLCDPCNRAIGMLKHDIEIIRSAEAYLS